MRKWEKGGYFLANFRRKIKYLSCLFGIARAAPIELGSLRGLLTLWVSKGRGDACISDDCDRFAPSSRKQEHVEEISHVDLFMRLYDLMIYVKHLKVYHFFAVPRLVSGLVVHYGRMQIASFSDRYMMNQ